MKKLLICLLSLLWVTAQAQNEKGSKFIPDRIGVFASPEWTNDYTLFPDRHTADTKANAGFNFGINTFYKLGKRTVLNVGFGYSWRSFEIQNSVFTSDSLNPDGVEVRGDIQRKFRNFIVPVNLYLEYGQYNDSPWFFYTSLGTEVNFLDVQRIILKPQGSDNVELITRGRDAGIPGSFLLNLGAGVGYQINEKSAFRLEPNFKLNIGNPFSSKGSVVYAYAWGVRAMFTYRLKGRGK